MGQIQKTRYLSTRQQISTNIRDTCDVFHVHVEVMCCGEKEEGANESADVWVFGVALLPSEHIGLAVGVEKYFLSFPEVAPCCGGTS